MEEDNKGKKDNYWYFIVIAIIVMVNAYTIIGLFFVNTESLEEINEYMQEVVVSRNGRFGEVPRTRGTAVVIFLIIEIFIIAHCIKKICATKKSEKEETDTEENNE